MKLYVGNLPYKTTDDELAEMFAPFGTVESAEVVIDKFSGRSRGFGFVKMSTDEEGQAAIQGTNGKEIDGRPLKVDQARAPRQFGND